jgi:dephospho-CoA kinase
MNKLYVVGVTGPMGSGKSEVTKVFEENNISIIDTDQLSRRVVEPGSPCLKQLVENFSEEILNADGTLNRRELAKRAFASKEKTKLLNSITHPYIIEMTKSILIQMEQSDESIAVIEAALLFESRMDSICDKTVAVIAPFEIRLERVLKRDSNLNKTQAVLRMSAQQPEEYYTERADFVIKNSGDFRHLREQTDKLAQNFKEWANEK